MTVKPLTFEASKVLEACEKLSRVRSILLGLREKAITGQVTSLCAPQSSAPAPVAIMPFATPALLQDVTELVLQVHEVLVFEFKD